MFEFLVNDDGFWEHWSDRVVDYVYPDDSVPEYSSILVPNVDNVRTAFLIDIISRQSKAVLLIGNLFNNHFKINLLHSALKLILN